MTRRLLTLLALVALPAAVLAQAATGTATEPGIIGWWQKWGPVVMPVVYAVLLALTAVLPKDGFLFKLVKAITSGAPRPPPTP